MPDWTHLLYWGAVAAFGLSTMAFGVALVVDRPAVWRAALAFLVVGFTSLTLALGLRWAETGHGPYLGRYEALGSYAWAAAAFYLVLQARMERLRPAGLLVAPAVLLLLGVGVLSPGGPQFESPAMRSVWLWVHVGTVKAAVAAFVLAAGASTTYLLRHTPARARIGVGTPSALALDLESLGELSVSLTSLGILTLAMAIGAGALWARTAWGSYWSWDPIETWALSVWVLYGMLLHRQRMWGLAGRHWAWLSVGVLGAAALSFLVIRLVSLSPHWIYLG